jgi:uncharacterized protein YxeA
MKISFKNPLILSALILILVIILSQVFLVSTEGFSVEIPYVRKTQRGDQEESLKINLDDPKLLEQVKKFDMADFMKTQQTYTKAASDAMQKKANKNNTSTATTAAK